MNNYIERSGSEREVMEELMSLYSLSEKDSMKCLYFLEQHSEILSDDELLQHCKVGEYNIDGMSEFVSEDGGLYLSVKKTTIFLAAMLLGLKVPAISVALEIAKYFGICEIDNGFIRIKEGEQRCLMLELAMSGKHGIEKRELKKYRGECCNNHIECRFKSVGTCSCSEKNVEEICDKFVELGVAERSIFMFGRIIITIQVCLLNLS